MKDKSDEGPIPFLRTSHVMICVTNVGEIRPEPFDEKERLTEDTEDIDAQTFQAGLDFLESLRPEI